MLEEQKAQEVAVNVRVDQTEIDDMMRKFERICGLLREANSLVDKLAAKEKGINIRLELDGRPLSE